MNTSAKFREQLRAEQQMHKDHRFKYVIYKLSFVTALFSIGSLGLENETLISLVYLVPIVAVCYDIYIFAEDYKVKRIGVFLLETHEDQKANEKTKVVISDIEISWERWLQNHRERLASRASLIITVVVTIGSVFVLSISIYEEFTWLKLYMTTLWLLMVIVFIFTVFYYGQSLRKEIAEVIETLKKNK